MHAGHLADTPDCPCPAPRAREIVAPIDAFHDRARQLGVPIIHVRTVWRKGGIDDVQGLRAAWRVVFPLYVGDIPNADAHAIEGTRWTEFFTRIDPNDLDFLLRNMRIRTVGLNGGFTDCCVLNAAFDASNRDDRVVVLRDLVRGTNGDHGGHGNSVLSDISLGARARAKVHTGRWSRLEPHRVGPHSYEPSCR